MNKKCTLVDPEHLRMKHLTFFLFVLFILNIESEENGVAIITMRHDLNKFFEAMRRVKKMLHFRKNILANGKTDDQCNQHYEKYDVSSCHLH